MLEKKYAGQKAAEYVKDGMIVGLGTGSTAFYAIQAVGELVRQGKKIGAVATSLATQKIAQECSIPLLSIDEVDRIDVDIDGVDEIDGRFNAIKGGGGALFREKMVAHLAKEVIWIMDESKLVDSIGSFPLPVEILPYGYTHILKKLDIFCPILRTRDGKPFVTDNGNFIADLHLKKPLPIEEILQQLRGITGVLEHGLFVGTCDRIIVGTAHGSRIIENLNK